MNQLLGFDWEDNLGCWTRDGKFGFWRRLLLLVERRGCVLLSNEDD